uniref:Uncharacterized protein n=1 Tax=Avena sativa TaxID=4498 RepID=A0ACD5ZB46_AVESA
MMCGVINEERDGLSKSSYSGSNMSSNMGDDRVPPHAFVEPDVFSLAKNLGFLCPPAAHATVSFATSLLACGTHVSIGSRCTMMEVQGGTSGASKEGKDVVEELLGRLNLQEEAKDDFVWEDEVADPSKKGKWLAIGRVHMERGFSPNSLYADMRSAWNPPKEVLWRKLEDSLFTIQFGCLGDWNKAMHMGPWLFRNNYGLLLEEYDGFQNPRSVVLDKLIVWARVLKLLDNYLSDRIVKGMCRSMGEFKEV